MRDEKKFKLTVWNNFITKTKLHTTMPIAKWTEYQFIGYFAEQAGYNLQPGKEKSPRDHLQVQEIRAIMLQLCGTVHKYVNKTKRIVPADFDRVIVKDYLDFCLKKFKNKKYKIHTAKIFNTLEYYQKFENRAKKFVKLDRSTELPENVKETCAKLNHTLRTYGDLAFMVNIEELEDFWNTLDAEHGITKDQLSSVI